MNFIEVLLFDYFSLLILFLVSAKLAIVLILFSYILVSENPDQEKLSTYECGYEPYETTRYSFNIKFFLIAIMFVIFDIEMLFIMPWCITIANLTPLSFWSAMDFIFELSVGFFYIWYTNVLSWQ